MPRKRFRKGAAQSHPKTVVETIVTTQTSDSDELTDDSRFPSVDEFILRSQEQSLKCLENAYLTGHELIRSVDDDSVYTTLCEDVFSLVNIQFDVLHEYLLVKKIDKNEIGLNLVVVTLLSLVRTLHLLQQQHRDRFLKDLESSCAAANDFLRMIDCFDDLLDAAHRRYPRLRALLTRRATSAPNNDNSEKMVLLDRESSDLVALYGNDAVYSVQRSQIYVMKIIQSSSIQRDLFSLAWEDEYIFNEVSLAIVNTLEDFLCECYDHLSNAFLYGKLVNALVQSTVCFYVQCLVKKAEKARRQKGKLFISGQDELPFRSPTRAILRMLYDIEVFRTYFQKMAEQLPGLGKLVDEQLSVLVVIHECLITLAENANASTLEELIVVLHKRTGANAAVTKLIVKDLGLLAACRPGQRRRLNGTLDTLDDDLLLVSSNLDQCRSDHKQQEPRDHLQGFKLKDVLEQLYEHRIIFQHVRTFGPCINFVRKTMGDQQDKGPKTRPTTVVSNHSTANQTDVPALISDIRWAPDGKSLSQSIRCSKEEHEQTLKSLKERMFVKMKLHNLHFVTKHSAIDFDKRLKEINERIF